MLCLQKFYNCYKKWLWIICIWLYCLILSVKVYAVEYESIERILEIAHDFLTDQVNNNDSTTGSETHIELGQLDSRLQLTRCAALPIAQFAPGSRAQGVTSINVRCTQPVPWSLFISARIERYLNVIVVARPLARDQVIQSADVRIERMNTARLMNGYFTDPAIVIGLAAQRRLIPDQVLTRSQVIARKLIERGQSVVLYSAHPGIDVRVKGEALESGTQGQRIRVKNRSSGRIVEGIIESADMVRVGP